MKKQYLRAGMIAATALASALVLTPAALADETTDVTGAAGATGGATYADAIQLAWEATGPFESATTVTIFPNPRLVPGDVDTQSLFVRNDGPTSGEFRATLTNVQLAGDTADEFYMDFLINGVPVADLYGADHELATLDLAQGEVVQLDFDYEFPEAATSGNYPEEGTVAVSFDVAMQIGGELPPPPPVEPPVTPPAETPATPPAASPQPPRVAMTGFDSLMWMSVLAAGVAGAGIAVYRSRRESRRS